jgi:hypothetical protein
MVHATLVTAYYPIKSKFPEQQYMEWAANFLALSAPIVLFTPASHVSFFARLRGLHNPKKLIHIIPLEFEDLYMWKQYHQDWRIHHTMDHEANSHSPELYTIWAQKAVFVDEAIQKNPFNTDYFFWCDIGAFRESRYPQELLNTFPSTHHLPTDRILFSSVHPLTEEDKRIRNFQRCDRIVGGLWGGSKHACQKWRCSFERQLIRFFSEGRFAGKDQTVMLCAYLENPTLAVVVQPTISGNPWFFLQYLLSDGLTVPYMEDTSYTKISHIPQSGGVSVSIMGGLGNQMFQVAAAYAHARTMNVPLVLRKEKLFDDTRPLYWDTAVRKFSDCLVNELPPMQRHTESEATFYTPIPRTAPLYLYGYYQSSKYFGSPTVRDEIRRLLKSNAFDHGKYEYLLKNKDRVVVMHARRTDYVKSQVNIDYHNPLSVEYYRKATDQMLETVKNPIFLLCSDDPMFWIESLSEIPALQTHPFLLLDGESDVASMALLQQFSYYIMANSSFSWWFVWLSDKVKRAIAPAKWFGPKGPKQYDDIYEPMWERIE